MDAALLRYFMRKHGDKQSDLAEALELSEASLSSRMTGKVDFRRSEINVIRMRYNLTADDLCQIFFAEPIA